MFRPSATAIVFFIAANAIAAAASRDAYIPIAGRATGAGGRTFDTTVRITNPSDERVFVTLEFLRSQRANPRPFTYTQGLAPHEIRRIALPDYLVGSTGVGALRVRATGKVLTTASVFSVVAGEGEERAVGASLDAVAAEDAIGIGETTVVTGVDTAGARFKLYTVETTAHPLYFTATLIDGKGDALRQKRYFIDSREARTFDVGNEFGDAVAKAVAVRLHGVNGSGRMIACGIAVATESQDSTVFGMSIAPEGHDRMPIGEVVAYLVAALAVAFAARRSAGGTPPLR
jgi:hypothetical protein